MTGWVGKEAGLAKRRDCSAFSNMLKTSTFYNLSTICLPQVPRFGAVHESMTSFPSLGIIARGLFIYAATQVMWLTMSVRLSMQPEKSCIDFPSAQLPCSHPKCVHVDAAW